MQSEIISKSDLFKGLSPEETDRAMKYFNAKTVSFEKGEILNVISKKMDFFGLVLEGIVQVYLNDIDGNQIIMATNAAGDSFGESLCFLEREAPVYIVAMSSGSFLKMNTENMKKLSADEFDVSIRNRFISILANRTLQMNNRIQILSKISIREKLLTFFAGFTENQSGEEIELPFNRNDMAIYLGVNRSALSRELGAMQAEGMIEYHKNKFRLFKI